MSTSTTSPAKAARTKDGKSNGSTTRTAAVERPTPATAAPAMSARPSDEDIARRAYEIYEREGRQPGSDLQNWLKAEAELCGPKGH
jgi:hypothetical protein